MLEKRIHLVFNNNYNPVFLLLPLFWFKANVVVESIPLIPTVGELESTLKPLESNLLIWNTTAVSETP